MKPVNKGIILIYLMLTATGPTLASPFVPYTRTCPAYKKAMRHFSGTAREIDRLTVLSAKPGCPGKQTAILDAALNCYDRGKYICAMTMAGLVNMERLLPTANLCQARSAFHLGKLQKGLKILKDMLKRPALRAPAMILRLQILCRTGECKEGITKTLSGIEVMDSKNLFRIRMMLAQAFIETGQRLRALKLMQYLYFNSVNRREKVAMQAMKRINPLQAQTNQLVKMMLNAKKTNRFIRRHYSALKKHPKAWKVATQIRSQDRQDGGWAVNLAYALKEDRLGNGKPLIELVKSGKWFVMLPRALDRVCTVYCRDLRPDNAQAIIKKIPVETGYRPIARMKLGLCLLQQGRNHEAAQILAENESVTPKPAGIIFGLKEQTIALAALAAMRENRIEEAVRAWKRLSRAWPYTFLSVLARTRLKKFGRKPRPIRTGKLIHDLSPLGLTGLELLRLKKSSRAIELLTSIRSEGLIRGTDTQVLARLLKKHRGLRAELTDFLRGAPHRYTRHLFRIAWPRSYKRQINIAGKRIGIPTSLIFATARAESRFRAWAVSRTGAYGLMQVQKHTARMVARRILKRPGMARSLFFPMNNLLIGGHYLKLLVDHFNGYLPLALMAYNAGLTSATDMFMRSKGMPTELFVISLRPKIVRFYVAQILGMSPAYGFLYHTPISDCLLKVPDTVRPFPVNLSL